MKKLMSIMMLVIMTVSLLAGCSPDEMTYLQMSQNIYAHNAYTMTGAIDWDADMDALIGKFTTDPVEKKEILRIIQREQLKHFTYEYKVNISQNIMSAKYAAGGVTLFDVVVANDNYYINMDGFLDIIRRNDAKVLENTEVYKKLDLLKGKYLVLDVKELLSSSILPSGAIQPSMLTNMLPKRQQLNRNVMTYFMDYAKQDLAGYNTGLMTKSKDAALKADVYTITAKLEDMPLFGMEFIKVVLDKLDGTERFVLKMINDPLFAEQAGMDSATMSSEVKSGFSQIRENLDTTKVSLEAALLDEKTNKTYGKMASGVLGNLTAKIDMADLGGSKYFNRLAVTADSSSDNTPLKGFSFVMTANLDASTSPTIAVPTSTITFKAFNDALPHSLSIDPDSSSASYDNGVLGTSYLDVEMVNHDGFWFISLHSLPARYSAMVTWNGQAYTIGDQVLGSNEAYRVGDIGFVALSAFRKAGVDVSWNPETRLIILSN